LPKEEHRLPGGICWRDLAAHRGAMLIGLVKVALKLKADGLKVRWAQLAEHLRDRVDKLL